MNKLHAINLRINTRWEGFTNYYFSGSINSTMLRIIAALFARTRNGIYINICFQFGVAAPGEKVYEFTTSPYAFAEKVAKQLCMKRGRISS